MQRMLEVNFKASLTKTCNPPKNKSIMKHLKNAIIIKIRFVCITNLKAYKSFFQNSYFEEEKKLRVVEI